MNFYIGLPQLVFLIMCFLAIIVSIISHGKVRKYNVWIALFGFFIELSILYWGGFFSK